MQIRTLLPLALLFSTSCNLMGKGACESLQKQICDECDVSDYEEDVICACLNEGEVDNADDYFEDDDEAELACDWIQQQVKSTYLTNEDAADCRRTLDFLKKHEGDACEYFGYDSGGGGGDGTDGSYYYTDGSDGTDGSYYYYYE